MTKIKALDSYIFIFREKFRTNLVNNCKYLNSLKHLLRKDCINLHFYYIHPGMIEILKTNEGLLEELRIDNIQEGSWINLVAPSDEEIRNVSKALNLDEYFLHTCLDLDERSRIEIEDGHLLIIVNIPIMKDESNFDTLPIGIIFTSSAIITVCPKKNKIIQSFSKETAKFFNTQNRVHFMLTILFRSAKFYLRDLNHINRYTDDIEERLRKTMGNTELFELLEVQKSLVYFTTAIHNNHVMLQKLMRLARRTIEVPGVHFNEDEIDLLEEVIIDNKQALDMVEMHRNVLENMMDAFASIISNNVGYVVKFLTALTILFAIPTMFASFWGMNTAVPGGGSLEGFYIVTGASLVATIVSAILFMRKKML